MITRKNGSDPIFLPNLEMKIPEILTGSEKTCKIFYAPNQHFLLAHTDMQELAASFTIICTELETEENVFLAYM